MIIVLYFINTQPYITSIQGILQRGDRYLPRPTSFSAIYYVLYTFRSIICILWKYYITVRFYECPWRSATYPLGLLSLYNLSFSFVKLIERTGYFIRSARIGCVPGQVELYQSRFDELTIEPPRSCWKSQDFLIFQHLILACRISLSKRNP